MDYCKCGKRATHRVAAGNEYRKQQQWVACETCSNDDKLSAAVVEVAITVTPLSTGRHTDGVD